MNGLQMNVAKTQLMVLTRKGKYHMVDDVEVKIGDTCLEKQNCVNYLGVKIDRDLSWRTHIDHLHRQCMAKLAVIRRASCYLPQNVRRLLYQAFVLPHVDYCSVVWNHCGVILRDRVERIQKYALRIIHGKPPRTSSEPLRRALGWTTLEKRQHKALVCLVHRCLSDEAPSFLCSKFRPNTALGYIRTRGANKLHLPRPKTEYFQSTFTFQGALLYNQLPEIIRRLKQFKSFKAALHDHLLN